MYVSRVSNALRMPWSMRGPNESDQVDVHRRNQHAIRTAKHVGLTLRHTVLSHNVCMRAHLYPMHKNSCKQLICYKKLLTSETVNFIHTPCSHIQVDRWWACNVSTVPSIGPGEHTLSIGPVMSHVQVHINTVNMYCTIKQWVHKSKYHNHATKNTSKWQEVLI